MGIATTYYDPDDRRRRAWRNCSGPNTTVLYTESPGSHTFEVQDIPALAAVAHARGAKVLMDNTWGIHFFQPFAHGVDVSIQALTKYVVGHSDVLLGASRPTPRRTGSGCASRRWRSGNTPARTIAGWRCAACAPWRCGWTADESGADGGGLARGAAGSGAGAAPGPARCPGHEIWKRDFSGACSLFGVVFQPGFARRRCTHDRGAELFGIGASWGGFESLVLPTTGFSPAPPAAAISAGRWCGSISAWRSPADLIADLERGLAVMREAAG